MIISLFVLSGCILVDDFGPYWDKGVIDRELEGQWYDQEPDGEGKPPAFVIEGDVMTMIDEDGDEQEARTLELGAHKFLMLPKDQMIQKYDIADGILSFYSPRKEQKEDFLKTNSNDQIVIGQYDTVRIRQLNEETLGVLEDISDQSDYWEAYFVLGKTPLESAPDTPVQDGEEGR